MTRLLIAPMVISLFVSLTSSVYAAKGEVVLKKRGCDHYLVRTVNGYALLEWFGGNDPDRGDILVGDFESYGMKDIYNITADEETKVWVEDFYLSRSRAIEKYYDKCD